MLILRGSETYFSTPTPSIPTNPSTPLRRLTLSTSAPLKPRRYLTVPSSSPPSRTSKMSEISVVPPGRVMGAKIKELRLASQKSLRSVNNLIKSKKIMTKEYHVLQ